MYHVYFLKVQGTVKYIVVFLTKILQRDYRSIIKDQTNGPDKMVLFRCYILNHIIAKKTLGVENYFIKVDLVEK